MKVVLDTNVVVSGLLSPSGPPASILNLVVNSRIQLLYDNRILHEYIEVLHREKFGFASDSINVLVSFFVSEGEFIAADPVATRFKDDDDRVFCEVLKSGQADFLISGNLAHFPKDSKIVSPFDFVKVYRQKT